MKGNGEILSQVVSSQVISYFMSCKFVLFFSSRAHVFRLTFTVENIKADLLALYGGVAPKMAEEAHSQVIDQVSHL